MTSGGLLLDDTQETINEEAQLYKNRAKCEQSYNSITTLISEQSFRRCS